MLAHMDKQALALTIETGIAHYYSRSRQTLWKKGETSGNLQHVEEMRFDCDQDAVVIKVLMIGDGLNDTLALTEAWASIAPGTALEASQNAADVVLLGQKMLGVPLVLRIARSARRRILENFALAAGYNAVAIPLSLMGFASPLMAALAMSSSSLTVTLNALRTR